MAIINSGFTPQIAFNSKSTSSSAAAPAQAEVNSNPADGVTLSSSNASSAAPAPVVTAPAAPTAPGAPTAPKLKEWTMLVYFASDNNLYPYEVNNLHDAETVGSTDQMNVVAQMSHAPKASVEHGHVVRYEVTKGKPGNSPVKQDLGDMNMSTPQALADFIKWGKANYPAKHYMLVCNDHGNGWQGCLSDDKHDGWFSLPQLEEGLKLGREQSDGNKLDVVGFDCCLMANIENLAQIKDEAKYVVGSEETEGGPGWTYNQIINSKVLGEADMALRTRDGLSPADMASKVVSMAHSHNSDLPTMTAFDMEKVPALLDATKTFGQAIKDTKIPNAQIAQAADSAQAFEMEADLFDFADKVSKKSGTTDKSLTAAAEGVKTAIENTIVAESHSSQYPGAHGLTVELGAQGPGRPKSIRPNPELQRIEFGQYKDLKFVAETGFNEAVNKFRGSNVVENQPAAV